MRLVRNAVGIVLAIAATASCSSIRERAITVPASCDEAPTPTIPTQFVAEIIALERDVLHMEFDDFDTWFDAITIEFSVPAEWKNRRASIYFQGPATFNGNGLSEGENFEFRATPPRCLDQPWLYLSSLQ